MENPQHDHQAPPPHDAPTYRECSVCGHLSAKPPFVSGQSNCPECGSPGAGRRPFPAERIRRVDARIRRYHAEGEHEVVVILVATFLETLLEDMLARIMAAEGASVKLRAGVLETQRSVGQRLSKLFPTLTGVQFEDAAAQAGFSEFPHHWRALRTERNAFIHDAAFDGQRESLSKETAEQSLALLGQAYALFVHINNRFVAGEKHRRSTDPHHGSARQS